MLLFHIRDNGNNQRWTKGEDLSIRNAVLGHQNSQNSGINHQNASKPMAPLCR